jgi:hypothetical protein
MEPFGHTKRMIGSSLVVRSGFAASRIAVLLEELEFK